MDKCQKVLDSQVARLTNMKENKIFLDKWMWWTAGECVVEVKSIGHFPTTAMVIMPNDKEIEVDINELARHTDD